MMIDRVVLSSLRLNLNATDMMHQIHLLLLTVYPHSVLIYTRTSEPVCT
jgi:hypothetical protein